MLETCIPSDQMPKFTFFVHTYMCVCTHIIVFSLFESQLLNKWYSTLKYFSKQLVRIRTFSYVSWSLYHT